MDKLILMFFSVVVGFLIGQLLLAFFMDEIFSGMDNVVDRVRKFFNLPT